MNPQTLLTVGSFAILALVGWWFTRSKIAEQKNALEISVRGLLKEANTALEAKVERVDLERQECIERLAKLERDVKNLRRRVSGNKR